MPSYDMILNAFITLFVTIDPIGLAPVFLGVTTGMDRQQRYGVAIRSVIIGFGILTAFSLIGIAVLDTLGITIHAFRVAGGLLLFYIAFEMVFEKRKERQEKSSASIISSEHINNLAVFPLAIPLIAGPGAISASILLSDEMGGSWQASGVLIGVIFAIIVLVMFSFIAAEFIDKYLGNTGRMILTRLLGVLLSALAVQFVADGAIALFSQS